jgi:hypothetical protein
LWFCCPGLCWVFRISGKNHLRSILLSGPPCGCRAAEPQHSMLLQTLVRSNSYPAHMPSLGACPASMFVQYFMKFCVATVIVAHYADSKWRPSDTHTPLPCILLCLGLVACIPRGVWGSWFEPQLSLLEVAGCVVQSEKVAAVLWSFGSGGGNWHALSASLRPVEWYSWAWIFMPDLTGCCITV